MTTDRLQQIRERLDRRRVDGRVYHPSVEMEVKRDHADFIAHAPADIAWLLEKVERLSEINLDFALEVARLRDEVESLNAALTENE